MKYELKAELVFKVWNWNCGIGIVGIVVVVGIEGGLHQVVDYKRYNPYFLQIFTLRPSILPEKILV